MNLCKDCAHIRLDKHPRATQFDDMDDSLASMRPYCRRAPRGGFFVAGIIKSDNFVACDVERGIFADTDTCGPDGKYFEARA